MIDAPSTKAPANASIDRFNVPQAAHTAPGQGEEFADTTFYTFAPKNISGKVPILLFAHGFGQDVPGSAFLAQSIADGGYLVVAFGRTADLAYNFFWIMAGLNGCGRSETLSFDGKHLLATLKYAKEEASSNGSSPLAKYGDAKKIAVMGLSMGGMEVMNCVASAPANDISAVIFLSPGIATIIVTVVKMWYPTMKGSAKAATQPGLFLTAEGDLLQAATGDWSKHWGGDAKLLTIKESALDLDNPFTKAGSHFLPLIWRPCGDRVTHLAQHFALGGEEKSVSHVPVLAFLDSVFKGKAFTVDQSILADNSSIGCWPMCCMRAC